MQPLGLGRIALTPGGLGLSLQRQSQVLTRAIETRVQVEAPTQEWNRLAEAALSQVDTAERGSSRADVRTATEELAEGGTRLVQAAQLLPTMRLRIDHYLQHRNSPYLG